MNDNALSEDELLGGLFDAIAKGDASAVNRLMASEVKQDDPAPQEPAPVEPEPTPEPTASTAPEGDEPPKEPQQEAPPADDWRTKLPEDIREKVIGEFDQLATEYQRLEHYRRSNEGRVAALHRKIEELEAAKQQLASKPSAPAPKVEIPQVTQDKEDPVLEELKEADPALYQALAVIRKRDEERFSKILNETVNKVTQEVQSVVTPLQERQQKEYINTQVRIVKETVPEIENVMRSDAWQNFYREASPAVRQLLDSPHADEFLTGVDAFTMYLYRTTPPDQMPRAPQAAPAATSVADKVQETRNRRLAASTPTNRAPAASPAQELDDAQYLEKVFQQYWAANRP